MACLTSRVEDATWPRRLGQICIGLTVARVVALWGSFLPGCVNRLRRHPARARRHVCGWIIFMFASVGSWRREAERFRRRETGPEEVAERPNQAPNGSTRLRRSQAGTSTRGAERAARASGCVATRRGARVGSGELPIKGDWKAVRMHNQWKTQPLRGPAS